MRRCKRIAFYGKGGIGKSTVAAHTAAALALDGLRVLMIGCDPKADSTRTLMGGRIPSVLDVLKQNANPDTSDFIRQGFAGVSCVESGGPAAGIGCAGRGIITALEELTYHRIFEKEWDVVIYDVLGDVVCGGFSAPMRDGFVDEIYIVTTSEYMSLYAANNILNAVAYHAQDTDVRLGGLIFNQRAGDQSELVYDFSEQTGAPVVGTIGHYAEVYESELAASTVIQQAPASAASENFRALARTIYRLESYLEFCTLDEAKMEQLCATAAEKNKTESCTEAAERIR